MHVPDRRAIDLVMGPIMVGKRVLENKTLMRFSYLSDHGVVIEPFSDHILVCKQSIRKYRKLLKVH